MTTKRIVIYLSFALSMISSWAVAQKMNSKALSDQEIIDTYQYYIGRLLILRQQNVDFQNGFKWNTFVHRAPGNVDWANPNLDVVYSEAWINIDKNNCTMLEIPEITGRYYTVQTLNGWGETTSNINERTYRHHPAGKFAYCGKDSTVALAGNVQRVTLPSDTSRILARIEIGKDVREAQRLQQQMKLSSTGKPKAPEIVKITSFSNQSLPGIEAFDNASEVLKSAPDINPGMEKLQKNVLAIQNAAKSNQRERLNQVIRTKAIPTFVSSLATIGTKRNGWSRPNHIGAYGNDYKERSLINFAGIWANTPEEVVYFKTNVDSQNRPLSGNNIYFMTFPSSELPETLSKYFWSVVAVDSKEFKVVENPLKKYLLNNQTGVQKSRDGSLTLVFSSRRPNNIPESNWLPTPAGVNYHLTFRYYGPTSPLIKGQYFPPPLVLQQGQLAFTLQ